MILCRWLVAALGLVMLSLVVWRIDHPPTSDREEKYISAAMIKMSRGKYISAYTNIRKVLSLNPGNATALELLDTVGITGIPEKQLPLKQSLSRFKLQEERYPDSPHIKIIGATLWLKSGLAERAIRTHHDVAKNYPEISYNWYRLAIAQRESGQIESAMESIQRAVALAPMRNYIEALGELCFFVGEWSCAIEQYRVAFKNKKRALSARFGYLRALLYTGQYQLTIEFAENLLQYLSRKSKLPQPSNLKARFVTGQDTFQITTNLSLSQLIRYTKQIIGLSNTLLDQGISAVHTPTDADGDKLAKVIYFDYTKLGSSLDNPNKI